MPSPGKIEEEFAALEGRVQELLRLCQRLAEENLSLRASQEQLVNSRADVVARQEQARARVEAMINRLKALEHEA